MPRLNIHYCSIYMYTSPKIFFLGKEISGLEWELNLHTHISGVMLYQLSYQALGSKEGYTSAGSWCLLYQKVTFSYGTPLAVTMLSGTVALARHTSHQHQ